MPSPDRAIVTRFAPSPTGLLHLGHAYSALLAENLAKQAAGQLLLRIEDIDPLRCHAEFETAFGAEAGDPGDAHGQLILFDSADQDDPLHECGRATARGHDLRELQDGPGPLRAGRLRRSSGLRSRGGGSCVTWFYLRDAGWSVLFTGERCRCGLRLLYVSRPRSRLRWRRNDVYVRIPLRVVRITPSLCRPKRLMFPGL